MVITYSLLKEVCSPTVFYLKIITCERKNLLTLEILITSILAFEVLQNVHLSIFVSVINQLDAQHFALQYVYFMSLHDSSTCAHRQEVKYALQSLWYHHTETSKWSKITKIQFYKYEQIVVKFMCLYMIRAHVLIVRRSNLHYKASGIITLKQVSGLKLLKYNSIDMSK